MITQSVFLSKILNHTLAYEGGYSNNPADKGGETYRGISRKYNSGWSGWSVIDAKKATGTIATNTIFPELENNVASYYWNNYFLKNGFNKLTSANVALQLFDYAVNGGYKVAAVNTILKDMGIISTESTFSDKLAELVNSVSASRFATKVLELRKSYYDNIIKADSSQEVFRKGWYARLAKLAATIPAVTTVGLLFFSGIGAGLFFWAKKKGLAI